MGQSSYSLPQRSSAGDGLLWQQETITPRPEGAVPSAGLPHRDLRRFYKVTLAETFGQWEREGRAPEPSDCLRCFLAERGAPTLTGRPVCTATLPVPEGQITLSEADLDDAGGDNPLQEPPGARWVYAETMALSTAVGATVAARINLANDPPAARVVGRRMDHEPPVWSTTHQCVRVPRPGRVTHVAITYRLRDSTGPLGAPQRHAVLYAAPGFGKTTLQHRLAGRGVVFADTDDVPGATRQHVRELLQWTSVLTNRLDLLDPDFATVAFVPADASVLGRRGVVKQLTDDDLDYWSKLHLFANHRRIVRFLIDGSCLSDWIRVDKWPKPPEARIGPDLEDQFLQKIRDLGGTTQ